MKEIVICAAVKAEDGTIVRGHRHHVCMWAIRDMGKRPMHDPEAQGFITSQNRFVTRAEGYDIQIAAGIKSANTEYAAPNGYCQEGQLYSEDLY